MSFQEKNIRKVFFASLTLKGISAFLEFVGGILFLFTGTITTFVSYLIRNELIEDPTDFLANHVQKYLPYFSAHAQLFGAFYLLSHGVVKIFLVISLMKRKLWAYPVTIWVLGLFILYQMYRFTYTHSFFLILLTVFDLFIIVLTLHEYKVLKGVYNRMDKQLN